MTGFIIGNEYSRIGYSKSTGRWRDLETGQWVPAERLTLEVDREVERTVVRLRGIARLLASDRISLPEFQERFADELRLSHLRMSAFGAGGRAQLDQRHFGYVGRQLKTEYEALDRLAKQIASGRITEKQLLDRAAMYATNTRASFYRSEQITKQRDLFLGWRQLSVGANHCEDCISYATDGFVPADQIKPTATGCQCLFHCRCFIVWKRGERVEQAILPEAI